MATTTNFGWETPDDTDLVKDGALAIRTLGNSIDTSLVDLKGGTTGQVLSKTSNTDMDFTWVTSDDANAIQNAIVDAKGDLIAASAADTPARLAVGNNGETLVADSSTSTGLRWQGDYAAGKNKIINGDFNIWQRGTSFTMTNGVSAYTADRFSGYFTHSSGTATVTRQAFTAGTAPVSGYEAQYFLRATKPANNSYCIITQPVEDVRTFAGQTVTLSFWAKVNSGTQACTAYIRQKFGSGGSADVNYNFNYTATTSWQRFTFTQAIGSMSGKTIGANSYLSIDPIFNLDSNGYDIDIWGVQLEAGNVATAFQTATGTLAGERSACERYYFRLNSPGGFTRLAVGQAFSSTTSEVTIWFPNTMRTSPSALEQSGTAADYCTRRANSSTDACTAVPTFTSATTSNSTITLASTNLVAGDATMLLDNNKAANVAFLAWSAEL